jgi:hypothetical protein
VRPVHVDARVVLDAAEGTAKISLATGEAVYTDREVRGLGKNYMRESSRRAGIEAYTFFIRLYALDALLALVENGKVSVDGTVGSLDRCVRSADRSEASVLAFSRLCCATALCMRLPRWRKRSPPRSASASV